MNTQQLVERLQRIASGGRDIQHGTGIGSFDIAVKKLIGQVFDRDGVARAQCGDDRLHLRRHRIVVEMIEQHRETIAPGGISAMSIRGERRHAGIDRLLDDGLFKTGESRKRGQPPPAGREQASP